jgi:hypothetical protein
MPKTKLCGCDVGEVVNMCECFRRKVLVTNYVFFFRKLAALSSSGEISSVPVI